MIIVPAFEPGLGGGHLTRCMKLTADLRAAGRQAVLFVSSHSNPEQFFQSMNFDRQWRITEDGLRQTVSGTVEFVVLDRFQTPQDELLRWKDIAPVIGIDEGGRYRDNFDFLIDILAPKDFHKPAANITSPSLLKFPSPLFVKTSTDKTTNHSRIKLLVSFGHEDKAGLGLTVSRRLCEQNDSSLEITLLTGELADRQAEILPKINNPSTRIKILKSISALAETLAEYDIVITHYGITAYETLYAGTPVLLVNPTPYHKKLSKAAGFFTAKSIPQINRSFLKRLKNHCAKQAAKLGLNKESGNLAALIDGFSLQVNRFCPVCGKKTKGSTARFSERTYRRCPHCGIIYMDRTCSPPFEYGKEYFFDMYQKQYGKTYIEDFPNLIAVSKRRLSVIKSLLVKNKNKASEPSLLDIGCAYGPFLVSAREEGFSPSGIDPAQDAVNYIQNELNIPAVAGFFPDSPLPVSAPFDTVTLWFVIEHFPLCIPVLAEINGILKPGGVLAFSTPSFSGISGRSSLYRFLEKSPADHFTIWSPQMCKDALLLAGFTVKKITIGGHHPERFPLLGRLAGSKISPLYWILLAVSKIFRLGDTFEVYAVKN